MTSKFPGRPTTPMAAWKPARTCEKTIQHIPCKSILMNRWCFCLQVAMREFLLTISIRYQAEFQVMRIKKYKFEEYYLIQYKILRTNIWRVVIKDVNQWDDTGNLGEEELRVFLIGVERTSMRFYSSTTELGCLTTSVTTPSSWSSPSTSMPMSLNE